ncbi:hypothetical protein ALTERO38_51693 [Alteromonas sp. 38]|nr:hypothetical protein ALTER154_80242 [Alteromonas sp. 154]VXB83464.1 hypothetical protein ALTERO38_51693 [Alteromonas sp. 38]
MARQTYSATSFTCFEYALGVYFTEPFWLGIYRDVYVLVSIRHKLSKQPYVVIKLFVT